VTNAATGLTLPPGVATPNDIGVAGEVRMRGLLSDVVGTGEDRIRITVQTPDGPRDFDVYPDAIMVQSESAQGIVLDVGESKATARGVIPSLSDGQTILYDWIRNPSTSSVIAVDLSGLSDDVLARAADRAISFGNVELFTSDYS